MASALCWSYLVVSSDKQSETLPHQRAWANEVAKKNGWHVDREFADVSSGNAGPRKLITRLLAEVERLPTNARPQWVLMLRIDRVGRGSIVESQVVVHRLKQLGVRIWTRFPEGEVKNESAMEELMVAFSAATARMDNDIKREKSVNAHARIKREGKHYGHAPYGTVLVERRPVAYEPEAVIVRTIFQHRLEGWGVHRLAKWAARNAPDKRKADGSFRKMRWATGTIEGILACANHRGVVVDEETYDAVQAMKTTVRRREAVYPWPLRGAVRCTCGYLLTGHLGGSGKSRRRYYLCKNVAVHDSYPLHRADALEAQFAALLSEIVAHPETISAHKEDPADDAALRQRKRMLEKDRSVLLKRKATIWDLAEAGNISPADLKERLDGIGAEVESIEKTLEELGLEIAAMERNARAVVAVIDALEVISAAWANPAADIEDRQAMAAEIGGICNGLWVAPPGKDKAARSVLLPGSQCGLLTSEIRRKSAIKQT